MGPFLFGRQEYAAAIAAYKKATAINPAFSPPYNQMGYAYRFIGKYAEAEQAFKKYIELIPDDPNPYDSYAELLMKTGRFEESIKNYEKALAVDPNFIASYIGIGNNHVFMGQPRRGAQGLRASWRGRAQRRREAPGALLDRDVLRARGGHGQGAGRGARRWRPSTRRARTSSRLPATYNQMGNILLEAGRVDEAAAKFKDQLATIDKADVAAQVKEATRRQALFDEARVALGKSDLAAAKAKAAAYATAVGVSKIPFEVRQSHELAGRIALEEKNYAAAVAELRQANQQDPRVLYLPARRADRARATRQAAKEAGAQAADFNALSPTYGYVRGKAKAMLQTADKD